MSIKGRTPQEQEAYDAYFAKGGKVTVCPANERTENLGNNVWQRSKPGRPKKDAKKG